MDLGLAGKRILVTGGSRGIGRAAVERLTAEGASVAACARGQDDLDRLAAAVRDRGGDVRVTATDVTDGDALERWIDDSAADFGGIDGVVSNVSARVYRTDLERWRETFDIDLLQHVRIIDHALPFLRDSSGAIVVVSSIAAGMSQLQDLDRAYGPMKAAITSYAAQVAQLEGAHGVRVNIVSPGPVLVEDGFWGQVRERSPDLYGRAERLSVFGRLGRPDEIAAAIAFLLAPISSYTTAANLHVDGGVVKSVRY